MGSESTLDKRVMKWLELKGCHAQRHEDDVSDGIPDISFASPVSHVDGWIECKYREDLPKRVNTPCKLDVRKSQMLWIHTRGIITGRCWVLAQIRTTHLLFPWSVVHKLNALPYAELMQLAAWFGSWHKNDELWEVIK